MAEGFLKKICKLFQQYQNNAFFFTNGITLFKNRPTEIVFWIWSLPQYPIISISYFIFLNRRTLVCYQELIMSEGTSTLWRSILWYNSHKCLALWRKGVIQQPLPHQLRFRVWLFSAHFLIMHEMFLYIETVWVFA